MKKLRLSRESIFLIPILILSGVLNLFNISIEGYGNEYYAAGVKSMIMSFKNFFFVSYDPAGFVSIDKPPLGFMIQAISAKIFGFSGFSIILPQAIAGILSVFIIYKIVKRSFGNIAALISALTLAVTPIFVADSRNNTNDNLLVLVLLLACYALSIAAEKGKLKILIISLALVGIGFNIKMLQAYMIIPAIYITYLLSTSISLKKKIRNLAIGTAVLIVCSLAWAVIVDLVPANSRPFVGSSTNNTVMELIVGHNGLERLGLGKSNNENKNAGDKKDLEDGGSFKGDNSRNFNGKGEGPQSQDMSTDGGPGEKPQDMELANDNTFQGNAPMDPGKMGEKPDGNGFGGGTMRNSSQGQTGNMGGSEGVGITRLFSNNSLSDQIIWLFPMAVIGAIAAAIKEKLRFKLDSRKKIDLVLWILWLVPVFMYFSFTTGLFHPYYLTMLAPPISVLVGVGITTMWHFYNEKGWKAWLLPVSLLVNAVVQLIILYYYSSYNTAKILAIVVFIITVLGAVALILMKLFRNTENKKLPKIIAIVSFVGLLISPLMWASTTLFNKMSGTFPSAGLSLTYERVDKGIGSMTHGNDNILKLVEYLKENTTDEKYLVAVQSATGTASEIITGTGESVMTLGGFSGSDNILTLDKFKELVNKGEIRYIIAGDQGRGGNSDIMTWAKESGVLVDSSQWDKSKVSSINSASEESQFGRGNSIQLYDLKGSNK